MFHFTLPVRQITYKVNGSGLATVCIFEVYGEQQQPMMESMPFKLLQGFKRISGSRKINAETCVTYKSTEKDLKLARDNSHRTMVVEIELPSGMRLNEREIGFSLSRTRQVMYFKYERCDNKLILFINVPSSEFDKPMYFNWCSELLSSVFTCAPIEARVYDYLQQETQLVQLIPVQPPPSVLGYQFGQAVPKPIPTLESLLYSKNRKNSK